MSNKFVPQFVVIPGDTLKETIDELGMTQVELALRCELSPKTITEIVNGDAAITTETALRLEKALGIDASFWSNLEQNYQQNKARIEAEKTLDAQIAIAKKFSCYDALAGYGLVEAATDMRNRVSQLLSFFGVNSLEIFYKTEQTAFRINSTKNISFESLAAWLRWGEQKAGKTVINQQLDKRKLISNLNTLRKFTFYDPKVCQKQIQEFFASNGIIYLYLPYLEKTYVNGATRWIGDKALIQMSPRNKYRDIFWFSLFHEVGHIILHGKKDEFVEVESQVDINEKKSQQEAAANEFACEILIPNREYSQFVNNGNFSDESIKSFAKKLEIPADIIAGRLGHDGFATWPKMSHLRKTLAKI